MPDAYILLLLLLVNECVRINCAQEPFEKNMRLIGMPLRFETSKLIYSGVFPHHVYVSRYMINVINVGEKTRLVINRRGQEGARAEFAYGSTIKYPIIISIIILTNFLL